MHITCPPRVLYLTISAFDSFLRQYNDVFWRGLWDWIARRRVSYPLFYPANQDISIRFHIYLFSTSLDCGRTSWCQMPNFLGKSLLNTLQSRYSEAHHSHLLRQFRPRKPRTLRQYLVHQSFSKVAYRLFRRLRKHIRLLNRHSASR